MATLYQNITPDKLSSTDGVLEMFQISADNHFEDIGLNVQRGASTWNYYMGSSPRNGIIKIDNATFLQAYNNPNVPQVLYTLTNGNKICLVCDGGDYQICWLSPSNVRTNLSSSFYGGGHRDFLYDVQYWYSTNPQVSNKVYCSIIGWNSGRTIFKTISTFSPINLSAWTNLVNGAIPSADIIGTGGGATHIAKLTGALATLENNLSDILIVAGGGGGGMVSSETAYTGANAGGISGSSSNSADQSTGYAFGQGEANGGGGGLYGGYKAANGDSGGAGSGYIGNSLLSNKKMVGYNVPTSSAVSTKTESVSVVSANAESNKPKSGNGFVRIKFLRDLEEYTYTYDQLKLNTDTTKIAKDFGWDNTTPERIAFLESHLGDDYIYTVYNPNYVSYSYNDGVLALQIGDGNTSTDCSSYFNLNPLIITNKRFKSWSFDWRVTNKYAEYSYIENPGISVWDASQSKYVHLCSFQEWDLPLNEWQHIEANAIADNTQYDTNYLRLGIYLYDVRIEIKNIQLVFEG